MSLARILMTGGLCCALTACEGDTPQAGASGGAAGGSQDAGSAGSGASATGGSDGGGAGGAGAGGAGGALAGSGGSAGSGSSAGSSAGGAGATSACPPGPYGAPLSGTPTATLVSSGFGFIEGPMWLESQGILLFSDMDFAGAQNGVPPSQIRQLSGDTLSAFLVPSGSNGLALGTDGSIIACTHDDRSLSRIDPVTKTRTTIVDRFEGKRFNSPNDVAVRSDGTLYFTDPTWQLGLRPQEIPFKGVFRVSGDQASLVADNFISPNGIGLSPDESLLYVADDNAGHLRRFDVAPSGETSDGSVWASVPNPDGITVDCAGNVYAASSQGVVVFAPDGTSLGTISVGAHPANCAFGGSDHKTLFITARDKLYSIALGVPGPPSP